MGKRGKGRQERAAQAIRGAFLRAIETLAKTQYPWFGDLGTYYRVKKLKNGAVDGMLRLTTLPEGIPVSELLFDLSDADVFVPPKRFKVWASLGFIGSFAEPVTEKRRKKKGGIPQGFSQESGNTKRYDRFAGMEKVTVYSQTAKNLPANILTARDIADRLEAKDKRPEQILWRLYWQPRGKRPKRK